MQLINKPTIIPIPIRTRGQYRLIQDKIEGWSFRIILNNVTEGYRPFVSPSLECISHVVGLQGYTDELQKFGIRYEIKGNSILFEKREIAAEAAHLLLARIKLIAPEEIYNSLFEFNKKYCFGIKRIIERDLATGFGEKPSEELVQFFVELYAAKLQGTLTVSIIVDHHTDEDLDLEYLDPYNLPIKDFDMDSLIFRPAFSEGHVGFSEITGFYIDGNKIEMPNYYEKQA